MRLYHSTPARNKAGIERTGFADTPESGLDPDCQGHTWFSFARDMQNSATKDRDWWVIVDVPDDVVEAHRYTYGGQPDPFQTRLPHHVVNQYQPFAFEPITADATDEP